MNLVICLLSTRQFIPAEKIRSTVQGYNDSKTVESFNRMFERDKNELRALGIPVETGRTSRYSTIDGYRISPEAYALPPIELDRDEAAAVAIATSLWTSPELSTASQSALIKLRAGGIEVDTDSDTLLAAAAPRSVGSEQTLQALFDAIENRAAVRFDHRSGTSVTTRTLEPWGVVTNKGRWYVVGHDRDRDATRTFRLSRIVGQVQTVGAAGEVSIPADIDLSAIVADAVNWADTLSVRGTATVWVAEGRAAGLRRAAVSSTPNSIAGRDGDNLELEIESLHGLTRLVLSAGADAVVLDPPELRAAVVDGLTRLAESSAVGVAGRPHSPDDPTGPDHRASTEGARS